jgi:hypothetical protein
VHPDGGAYVLFLCGYFNAGSLGYEAADGIDWIWEHRIDEANLPDTSVERDLVGLCKELNALLTDIDAENLTAAERRSLRRTADLTSQVLQEIANVDR